MCTSFLCWVWTNRRVWAYRFVLLFGRLSVFSRRGVLCEGFGVAVAFWGVCMKDFCHIITYFDTVVNILNFGLVLRGKRLYNILPTDL